jgi:hypothetical protein
MKGFFYVFLAIVCWNLFFGDRKNGYDNGYDDAWSGKSLTGFFKRHQKEYVQGYEDGSDDARMFDMGYDAYMFDMGYDDAVSGKRVSYPHDIDYMDGFKDGKRNR